MKTPDAGHPLPKGEGRVSDLCPTDNKCIRRPLHMGALILEKPTILWFSLYFRFFSC
jgi:hypothetical protein